MNSNLFCVADQGRLAWFFSHRQGYFGKCFGPSCQLANGHIIPHKFWPRLSTPGAHTGMIGKQVGDITWHCGSSVCHQPWFSHGAFHCSSAMPTCVCASIFTAFRSIASDGDTVTLVQPEEENKHAGHQKPLMMLF